MSRLLLLVALSGCGPRFAPCPTTEPQVSGPLASLAWLSGTWSHTSEDGCTQEAWSLPRGTVMMGWGITLRGSDTAGWEHLRIEVRNADVILIASPSGQATTEFRLTTPASERAERLLFENPDHDFPTRIEYRRSGDAIAVHIEGADGQGPSWTYQSGPCP